jgi:hypothetical protein
VASRVRGGGPASSGVGGGGQSQGRKARGGRSWGRGALVTVDVGVCSESKEKTVWACWVRAVVVV